MQQKILIVDDDQSFRAFEKAALERVGYQVEEAESVHIAEALVKKKFIAFYLDQRVIWVIKVEERVYFVGHANIWHARYLREKVSCVSNCVLETVNISSDVRFTMSKCKFASPRFLCDCFPRDVLVPTLLPCKILAILLHSIMP